MNQVAFSILSLLSREPLSGYELKKQMNDRISQFLKVSNNQIYPQLTKMESQGLIRIDSITTTIQHSEKRTYTITDHGREILKEKSLQNFDNATTKDGFLATIYNSWLLDDSAVEERIHQERVKHVKRIKMFDQKISNLKHKETLDKKDQSSLAIFAYGKHYDEMYRDWCDELLLTLK